MRRVLCVLASLVLLSLSLSACAGFKFTLAPDGADLCNGPVLLTTSIDWEEGEANLVAGMRQVAARADLEGPKTGFWLDWYRNGQLVHSERAANCTGGQCSYLADKPGTYQAIVHLYEDDGDDEWDDDCPYLTSNTVAVRPCGSCTRADVAVVIYGGWDGIPVQAYVGGTAQETLYTARDAFGEAAVLWTFYPPADEGWNVSVAPQTPAGKDPERWQYKLVRIEADGSTIDSPTGAAATVWQCSEHVFYFQLVDTGALP